MQIKSVNTVIATLVALVISIFVVSGILWINSSTLETVYEGEMEAMDNMVEQSMAALNGYIDQTESMVQVLASQHAVVEALEGGDPARADLLFKRLIDSSNAYWAAFAFDRNGMVVAGYNAKGSHMAGADRSSRAYVKAVVQGKTKTFLSKDVLISKSGGGIMIFAAASVVYDEAGEIIGGVGIFPKWEEFTSKFIDPFRVAGNGYAYMLDSKGRIIAHAVNEKLFLKDLSKYDFVQTALTQKQGTAKYEWEGREKVMVFDIQPKTGWSVVMSAYDDDLTRAAIKQRNTLTMGGAVAALLVIGIMIFLVRKIIINPVKGVLAYASGVADGNLDAHLEGRYRFEFAALSRQIEKMVDELKRRLSFSEGVLSSIIFPCVILGSNHKVLWTNQEMCDLLEKDGVPDDFIGSHPGEFIYGDPSRKTISDKALELREAQRIEMEFEPAPGRILNIQAVSTPFYDMEDNLLGSLTIWFDVTEIRTQQKQIEEQNEQISRVAQEAEEISQYLSSAAEELSAQIEQASRGAEQQRDRATETSAAMEQMNVTVLEVAKNASQAAEDADVARDNAQSGAEIVGRVIESVGEVQSQADNLKLSMEKLGGQAADIGKVLEVISDIADQTNLLALNAAIEAARAGEAGRGFAVVADEVRKLAEKTMAATSEVEAAINTIQSMTRDNVAASEVAAQSVQRSTELANESGESLQGIVGHVENAADEVRNIATAAEEQSATSEEINRSTDEINRISSETSQVMNEAAQAIQEVASMASRLNAVIEEMTGK